MRMTAPLTDAVALVYPALCSGCSLAGALLVSKIGKGQLLDLFVLLIGAEGRARGVCPCIIHEKSNRWQRLIQTRARSTYLLMWFAHDRQLLFL